MMVARSFIVGKARSKTFHLTIITALQGGRWSLVKPGPGLCSLITAQQGPAEKTRGAELTCAPLAQRTGCLSLCMEALPTNAPSTTTCISNSSAWGGAPFLMQLLRERYYRPQWPWEHGSLQILVKFLILEKKKQNPKIKTKRTAGRWKCRS